MTKWEVSVENQKVKTKLKIHNDRQKTKREPDSYREKERAHTNWGFKGAIPNDLYRYVYFLSGCVGKYRGVSIFALPVRFHEE